MDESMTKTDAREALSAYIDGELPADQAGALEALLASDQELATELQELRDVVSELGSLPQIEAPEGFFAAVMSRVEAGESGAVDGAGEVVDFDAERRRIAAIREAADAAEEPEQTGNVVFGGWWIKGPAIVAAAALLVIGLGQIIVAPDQGPPSMMAAAPRASSGPALATAPAPTGLATGDGIVDAGPPPLGLGDSSPEVAVGFAGSAAPPAPAARRSGIQVGRGSTQPAGVYAAEYELSDSGTEAEEEAVAGAAGEMAPEPEPKLAEPADPDGVISAGAGAAPGGDMAFGLAPSKAKASDESKADAAPAAGTLSVQAADGMRSLEAAVRARGWTVRYLGPQPRAVDFDGSVTSQSVEIAARGTDADLRGMLGGQGSLQMGAASPGSDGLLRVRLTVVHAPGE
jgi:anti-sigma factor RsiW